LEKQVVNFMTNSWHRCIVCALALGLAGCQQKQQPAAKTQNNATAPAAATKTAQTNEPAPPATAGETAIQTTAAKSTTPATTAQPTPPVQSVSQAPVPTPPAPPPSTEEDFESETARRKQTESMIYATIRIKMEEAIEKRATLLKAGKDPADEEVRSLEGTIMRARELLEENGEVVEPVDPPIVQSTPNP
jgi:hypothetical protein